MGEDAEILATMDAFKDLWPKSELLINRLDQGEWIKITTIKFDLNALKNIQKEKKEASKAKATTTSETSSTKRKRSVSNSKRDTKGTFVLDVDNEDTPVDQILGLDTSTNQGHSSSKGRSQSKKSRKLLVVKLNHPLNKQIKDKKT